MIKLTINLNSIFGISSPSVIRLGSGSDRLNSDNNIIELKRIGDKNNNQVWNSNGVEIGFSVEDNIEDGEIWILFPEAKKANRFYRPSSNSNTLIFTERCDQYCIMCSQPPKNKDYPYWDLFNSAIKELPVSTILGISGGEPLLEKEYLFSLIEDVILKRPDITFHILTNGQHFEVNDEQRLKVLNKNILWGIPLYSTDSEVHDSIVGKIGAFETLINNMGILYRSGAQIELRTVLLKQNVGYLSHIANFIADKLPWISFWALMQLEPIGFAKVSFSEKFYDNSENFSLIKIALDSAKIKNVTTKLYNFPSCTVDQNYRHYVNQSISDWKNKYIKKCESCSEKVNCCGFFEWYDASMGYQKIGKEYL